MGLGLCCGSSLCAAPSLLCSAGPTFFTRIHCFFRERISNGNSSKFWAGGMASFLIFGLDAGFVYFYFFLVYFKENWGQETPILLFLSYLGVL